RSFAAWLDGLGLGPLVRTYMHVWPTLDYGVEPEGLSLLTYARDERLLAEFAEGESGHAPDGLDQVTGAMAADLGGAVYLGTAATALAQTADGVRVGYLRDGAAGEVAARYAVVAVPGGVLRTLAVTPPWPPARQQAIAGLRYGHVLKVHLQFRRRFWHD